MKKFSILFFVLLFALILVGCGGNKEEEPKLESIILSGQKTGVVGDEITLKALFNPIDSEKAENIVWSSNKADVATVNNGKVTLVGAGEVTIKAAIGEIEATIVITVSEPEPEYTLELVGNTTANVGDKIKITAMTTSEEAIVWSSSDESIATVEDGTVTLKKDGKVIIKAAIGKVEATHEITVSYVPLEIRGSTTGDAGSSITLLAVTKREGEIVWTSSDASKATVANGVVTLLAQGEVTIKAAIGGEEASIKIMINPEPKKIAFIGEVGYKSIDDALLDAESGDIVVVLAGEYDEEVCLPSGVTLKGPNAEINPITGTRVDEAKFVGTITLADGAENAKILGFEFTGNAQINGYSTTEEIKGFTFENNYVHDTAKAEEAWTASRNYANESFLLLGCQSNKMSNTVIKNNKFENVSKINVFLATINGATIEGNDFHNFERDAVRIDGGYNTGVILIQNNKFYNDATVKGYNGIYFRSIGNSAEQALNEVKVLNNEFKNIGDAEMRFSGAIISNAYQEKGGSVEVKYNTIENCTTSVLIRNNATAENHTAYNFVNVISYNKIKGVPAGLYFSNSNGSDTADTNPAKADFNNNLFIDDAGAIITDIEIIKAKVEGAKDFATILTEESQLTPAA